MAGPFRVVSDDESSPLPHAEAQELFRVEWRAAREAYVDLLTKSGGPHVKTLLASRKSLTPHEIGCVRSQMRDLATTVRSLEAHVDAAWSAVERAARHDERGSS